MGLLTFFLIEPLMMTTTLGDRERKKEERTSKAMHSNYAHLILRLSFLGNRSMRTIGS